MTWNASSPAMGNQIANDIPDILENFLHLRPTVTAKTANYTLVAADLLGNTIFTNYGASAQINFTWPALAANQRCMFRVEAAKGFMITAPAGKTFNYMSQEGAAAGTVLCSTVGNAIEFVAVTDASSLGVVSIIGAWTYSE